MRHLLTCIVVGMLLASQGSRVHAQVAEPTVMLDWRSQEGCLDREALVEAVTLAQPRNSIVQEQAAVTIVGQAERQDGAWSVLFLVQDSEGTKLGERHLRVEPLTCAALKEHVVVVSLMLVDATLRELGQGEAAASPEVQTAPAASPVIAVVESPAIVRPSQPSTAQHRLRLGVGTSAELQRLPSASLGLRVSGGWGISAKTEILLAAALHPSALVVAAEGGETSISWNSLSLSLCPSLWQSGGFEISACGGMRIGAMRAEGRGFARNRAPDEVLLDGHLQAHGRRALGTRLFVALTLDGYVGLLRPRFGYENSFGAFEAIYEPSLLALGSTIALGLSFL